MMKRSFLTLIFAAVSALFSALAAAPNADAVLAKVASSLSKPASTTVTFDVKANGRTASGTMTVCKRLFTFSSGDLAVWYDGLTQWTLQRSAKEVSITEPTMDELMETNPFVVLTGYKSHFTSTMVSSTAAQYRIKLTAKSKAAAVKSAVVTVSRKSMQPSSIALTMQSDSPVTVSIKRISHGKALPKSFFTFSAKNAGKVTVNDLR